MVFLGGARQVDKKPWFSVEAKLQDTNISRYLLYFKERLNIPFNFQVIKKSKVDFIKDNIRVISVDRFLSALV
ncbi:hypothetical protein ACX8XN_05405 [Calditrichota bacterium GD2]